MDRKSIAVTILLLFALAFHMRVSAERSNQARNQLAFYKGVPEIKEEPLKKPVNGILQVIPTIDKTEIIEQSSTIENSRFINDDIMRMVEEMEVEEENKVMKDVLKTLYKLDKLISCFEEITKNGGKSSKEEIMRAFKWFHDETTSIGVDEDVCNMVIRKA